MNLHYQPILDDSAEGSGSLILVILLGLPNSDRHRNAVTGPIFRNVDRLDTIKRIQRKYYVYLLVPVFLYHSPGFSQRSLEAFFLRYSTTK